MSATSSVTADAGITRLSGLLELIAARREPGATFLRHQSFRAPVHLSKGHVDAGALVLNVVNPTAGLMEGDRLRVDVRVEEGARLVLAAPSASRVHTMRAGEAVVTQDFHVAAGGSLEWWPEMLIPQRDSRYRQLTTIHLDGGAELIFQETIAPGRVASGEMFCYQALHLANDVWLDRDLAIRERLAITSDNSALEALRRRFPTGYYISIMLASPRFGTASPTPLASLEESGKDVLSGVSQTAGGLWAIKALCADSLSLRRWLERARRAIYEALGRETPALRRAGWL